MNISYIASTHTFKVVLGPVTWTKILTPVEQAVVNERPNWAFSILGSTGGGVEANIIRNVQGTFTPGEPVVVTRTVDENGNDLQPSKTTLLHDWQESHPSSIQFEDSSTPDTIVKNDKTYRRSQTNGTFFANGVRTTQRLTSSSSKATVTTNGSTVTVTTNFDVVTFINYVYRQELPAGNADLESYLQLSVNGGVFNKTVDIWPGDTVKFKYTAKNASLPIWSKVTAVQSLGGMFKVEGNPVGVTEANGFLYVPLNFGTTNDLRPGQTGENTITMTYQGVEKAHLTADDAGQVKITYLPTVPNTSQQAQVVSKVAIYDRSTQLVDDSGNQMYGSYFYVEENDQLPLKDTDLVYHTANHIPATDSVTQIDLGWWNIDNGVLTIYQHKLDGSADTRSTFIWPWHDRASEITKVVIKPGVTANGSLKNLFADLSAVIEIEGLGDLDTTDVTDLNSMFKGCSSLQSLDLTKFKTTATTDITDLFKDTSKLWQLTLGKDTKLNNSVGLVNPVEQTPIAGTPIYYVTSDKWRLVGTGTVHEPKGDQKTVADIIADSQSATEARTYVWDQIGTQSLSTTSTINFGNQSSANAKAESATQYLTRKDNRNARTGKNWRIEAAVTQPFTLTTNQNIKISGDPLSYHNLTSGAKTKLTSTG